MQPRKNVIILTSGITGSSVFTGLISKGGYWTGDRTFKKTDYDTYENEELIHLNQSLLKQAGYAGDYTREFRPEISNRVSALYGTIDDGIYRAFVGKCEAHRPWIWKDPRLWLTIGFWKNVLNLSDCRFVVITRDLFQSWVSQTLRRQIQTYRYTRHYEEGIRDSILAFLGENHLPYLQLSYDQLIHHPDETVTSINRHLNSDLTVDHLKSVYKKPLYRSARRSLRDHMTALLIYLKNYSERLDLTPETQAVRNRLETGKPTSG